MEGIPLKLDSTWTITDYIGMEYALSEARLAAQALEVPIGCVIMHEGQIIASAHNTKESTQNPLAHAELLCIEKASQKLGSWRLENCTMYVTLEPCPMCASAIQQARIQTLHFASREGKMGAIVSTDQFLDRCHLNHHVKWTEGLLAAESSETLKRFFKSRRRENKAITQELGGRSKLKALRSRKGPASKGFPVQAHQVHDKPSSSRENA